MMDHESEYVRIAGFLERGNLAYIKLCMYCDREGKRTVVNIGWTTANEAPESGEKADSICDAHYNALSVALLALSETST